MTIASEITRIQNGVASAYSSVSTKGGTLPATQNLNNLPSAIESIPTGITPSGNIALTATTSTQTGIDVSTYATASVAPTPSETASATPLTTAQTITPSSGKLLSSVSISAMQRGALGTVSASKSISGNTATITPSISGGTAGYISETSKSGTATTVSASELTSGNKSITATTSNQTGIDVVNYKTVSVAPTPSETKSITANGTYTPTSGKYFSQVTVDVPAPAVNPNNYNYVLVKTDSGIEMQQIRKSASTYNSYTENSFNGYYEGYKGDLTIVGVNLNYATAIGTGRCERMFRNCTNLVSAKFNTIRIFVSAYNSVFWMFRNTGVKEASFPVLKEIAGGGGGMFYECLYLTTATFNKLDTFTGTYGKVALNNFFQGCISLANVYFYALKTSSFSTYIDQLRNMFDPDTALTSGTCTVHFPSNLSATIAGLTGYPTFGGDASRIVLAFDLPATS